MRVSLKQIKKYIDLPKNITDEQMARDLTLRTVEVENIEKPALKYHDIVVGKILEVKPHPDADRLHVCMVDIGEDKPVQIVCGGSNLYQGEMVVVCKPGAEVVWHGEGEPIKISETKMRGVSSYGMICASTEVYLEEFFPLADEHSIIDLKGIDCAAGDNIADVVDMNDTILEIDNKSLSNRPDLWGHIGIARELSTIYNIPLKEIDKYPIDNNLPKYNVEIKEPSKCSRYVAIEIDNVKEKNAPIWMQSFLVKCGLRPINAIVDITNYVMLVTGQPLHAFDKTHVQGEKIIVRNAKEKEELLLLDNNKISLTTDDLIIADTKNPLGLAGIRGGKNDSILPQTEGVLIEIANFNASTIRKTDKRFAEKTDAAMRYEKGIDTQRIDEARDLTLNLIKEIYPESEIVKYSDNYLEETKRNEIKVSVDFLNKRLGKVISEDKIKEILTNLGYEVKLEKGVYTCLAPTYRSTGDVTLKDDVMGDIARILSYDSFEAKPITMTFDHFVKQNNFLLERRIREYLATRCGFYEIYTYPWIDEKYINAAGIDIKDCISLATPPAPELKVLRKSLIPGMLEAIAKNLRYYSEFKLFENTEIYRKGNYSPSSEDEILPIQEKYLTGCIVGKDAKKIFYELKGVIESLSSYTHMEKLSFNQTSKPSWADAKGYLNITLNNEVIGDLGLVSIKTMSSAKIKRTNVAIFEINMNKLIPYASRTNEFEHVPELPLVEKDLAILVDENVLWSDIEKIVKSKVKELEFIEEYRGNQVPEGQKSITFRIKLENVDTTMTMEEINKKIDGILKSLNKLYGAKLREE